MLEEKIKILFWFFFSKSLKKRLRTTYSAELNVVIGLHMRNKRKNKTTQQTLAEKKFLQMDFLVETGLGITQLFKEHSAICI